MMTYENHEMAFRSEMEKELYFEEIAPKGVKAGTAMEHVLASNVGLWGDEGALQRDAAEIMRWEIETWALEGRHERLGEVPVPMIMNDPVFIEAFKACRAPNKAEIELLVENKGVVEPVPEDPSLQRHLGVDLVEKLHGSLVPKMDPYRKEMSMHHERLARFGAR